MKKWRENRVGKGMAVMLSAVLLVVTVLGGMPSETHASEDLHVHDGVIYEPWERSDRLPTEPGNYYLTKDVTITSQYGDEMPEGTTNLCLNGKTVKQSGINHVIWITESGTLNLYDCVGEGKICYAQFSGIRVLGKLYMYGGKIVNNWSNFSAGVFVYEEGEFYMYDGEISGNTAQYDAGGVVAWGGVFYMYGGKISGNTAYYASGVEMRNNGTVIIGGDVVISGNVSRRTNGEEENLFLGSGDTITIDRENPLCGSASIGISTHKKPTEEQPIRITTANDSDYSSYFFSDDENYAISDSIDHTVWLTVKGEHTTHVVESWSYDDDRHWKQCLLCGDEYEEEAHTFGEWVTDSEAMEEEDGEKYRECSVCGFRETETIWATRPTATSAPAPSASPVPIPSASPVPTPSATPVPTPSATEQPTPMPPATTKPSAAPTPTLQPTPVPTPPATKKPSATSKPPVTEQPTPIPPATAKPSAVPTPTLQSTPVPTSPATEKPTAATKPPATEKPTAAPKPPATEKPVATGKPSVTQRPSATKKPSATARPGEIRMTIEMGGNVPDTSASISAQELADFVLTEDEKRQVENGTDVTMRLTVVDAENRVSDADQAAVDTVSGSYVPGQYLDINLYKDMGGSITRITAPLKANIALTMAIPDRLKNTDSKKIREFAVVRVHDGEAAVLPDQDQNADTITIETDRFSTYAIVYKDTEVGGNNGTGNTGENGGSDKNDSSGGVHTGISGSSDGNTNNSMDAGNSQMSVPGNDKSTVSRDGNDNGSQTDSDDSQDSDKKNPGKKSDSAKKKNAKDDEPKTGDDTPIELVATLAMISGLSYVLLYFLERRYGMTEETKKEITARIISWARKGGRLRKGMAIAAIFVFIVYYHSIGKETGAEWKHVYSE